MKFLGRLLPFAIIIAIVLVCLSFVGEFKQVMVFAWTCYAMFLVLTVVSYYFSLKTMDKKFSSFMSVMSVAIFSKLILSAIMVLIFKMSHDTSGTAYIIPFAIIYFAFLFFETMELVKLSKQIGNNAPPPGNKPLK